MDPALNPYTPGSGRRPPSLQGRDREIDAFDLLVARAKAGHYDRGMILSGLRGVGKTALLNQLRGQAERHQWYTVKIEAQNSTTGSRLNHKQLAIGLRNGMRKFSRVHALKQAGEQVMSLIEGSSLSVAGVSVSARDRDAVEDTLFDIEEIVEAVCELVATKGVALAVFVDEMQDLDADLTAGLIVAQHRANQEGWPFYVIGAGLPNLPSVLAESRSYAERLFFYSTIGALGPDAARGALSDPAATVGGRFLPDALDLLLAATEGYPYFLQEFGSAAWEVSAASPFGTDDAAAAIEFGTAHLDQGFFPSRWDRATPAERRYLRSIAETGQTAPRTAELSISQNTAGPLRAALIRKGIVYSPEHGRIAFTVPGMSGFIARQPHNDE
ncbi:ATP-binding protein [Williamsia herbipolensis]|uniref:ATP-binding protein n=1 Tax=Williamsia herbipolensis TaxID=1603258 RepID=UPI0005F7CC1D|nr:ATP-binding protein [Williamsia herbipolensis]